MPANPIPQPARPDSADSLASRPSTSAAAEPARVAAGRDAADVGAARVEPVRDPAVGADPQAADRRRHAGDDLDGRDAVRALDRTARLPRRLDHLADRVVAHALAEQLVAHVVPGPRARLPSPSTARRRSPTRCVPRSARRAAFSTVA